MYQQKCVLKVRFIVMCNLYKGLCVVKARLWLHARHHYLWLEPTVDTRFLSCVFPNLHSLFRCIVVVFAPGCQCLDHEVPCCRPYLSQVGSPLWPSCLSAIGMSVCQGALSSRTKGTSTKPWSCKQGKQVIINTVKRSFHSCLYFLSIHTSFTSFVEHSWLTKASSSRLLCCCFMAEHIFKRFHSWVFF